MQNIDLLIKEAKQAEIDKQWDLAAELYQKAQGIAPDEANWLYRHGLSLERAKRYVESIESYKMALNIKQKHEWWHRLGVSAECSKNGKLAKEAYSRSLDIKPGDHTLAYQLLEHSVTAVTARFRTLEYLNKKLPEIQNRVSKNKSTHRRDVKIFTYWDSGFERAPAVVKACYREMVRIHGKNNVIALDSENWHFYADIPNYILDKVPLNKAHFSDILRVALLSRYGGIWVDATCLLARNVISQFDDMSKSGFFSYHYSTARISSWFLCSSGENYIAKMLFESLVEYWKEHDVVQHYFMLHHMLEVLYLLDEKFRNCWDESTKASSKEPHIIQKSMLSPYNEFDFKKAYYGAAVHKLTYKFKKEGLKANSVLAHIVRGDF